jgi:hypothetical protein
VIRDGLGGRRGGAKLSRGKDPGFIIKLKKKVQKVRRNETPQQNVWETEAAIHLWGKKKPNLRGTTLLNVCDKRRLNPFAIVDRRLHGHGNPRLGEIFHHRQRAVRNLRGRMAFGWIPFQSGSKKKKNK